MIPSAGSRGRQKGGKALRFGLVVGILLGGTVGSIACYAAWVHNPQNEFHGPTGVNWSDLAAIWVSWLMVVGLPGGTMAGVVRWLWGR